MERLVRKHPSTIMVSYINERFPNAEGQPQRSFGELAEYERLFTALDQAVLITNPDRVIKAGDGDYDPPSPGLPDSHCYNGWYNATASAWARCTAVTGSPSNRGGSMRAASSVPKDSTPRR